MERRFVGTPADPAPHTEPTTEHKPDPGWNKLLLVVGAIAVVVALLVVPGILNRGGKNPVADAAEATSNSPGVQFTFSGRAQGPAAISMSGKGAMNGETNRVSIEMSATGSTPQAHRASRSKRSWTTAISTSTRPSSAQRSVARGDGC